MALKFIDIDVGLPHLWSKIKALIAKNGTPTVTATSSDGVTYTATLSGVTALTTGLTITIVPNKVSTSISAKLNLNNLGAKYIRQSTTNNTATGLTPKNAGWMAANKPITIQYDGTQWKTIAARSNASDMNGTLAIANGGTGATSAADARTNLGLGALATLGTVPIANGGTGATTVAGARNALGLGNTSGAVPVANGGTGATTAEQARANLGISNINTEATDYIIESYRNGTEWYEVYKSGKVRQGGIISMSNGYGTATFAKAFADTDYFAICFPSTGRAGSGSFVAGIATSSSTGTRTTTNVQFGFAGNDYDPSKACWLAEGQGA